MQTIVVIYLVLTISAAIGMAFSRVFENNFAFMRRLPTGLANGVVLGRIWGGIGLTAGIGYVLIALTRRNQSDSMLWLIFVVCYVPAFLLLSWNVVMAYRELCPQCGKLDERHELQRYSTVQIAEEGRSTSAQVTVHEFQCWHCDYHWRVDGRK